MSRTRIVILQMRELIYTAIFVGLGIFLVVLLVIMFWPGKSDGNQASLEQEPEQIYEAGIYTKELKIGDATVNLQLCLDENQVKSVELINLDETVETMYPLMAPTVEKISKQLSAGSSVEEIVLTEEAQYTEKIIVETVNELLHEHEKE